MEFRRKLSVDSHFDTDGELEIEIANELELDQGTAARVWLDLNQTKSLIAYLTKTTEAYELHLKNGEI